MAYSATAQVQFTWSADGTSRFWTGQDGHTLAAISNSTWFSTLGGFNTQTYYNADFATPAELVALGCPDSLANFRSQYGCKVGLSKPLPTAAAGDLGPGPAAAGVLTITDTTLTGTLTVLATSDEGAGPQLGTAAASGFNVRFADGSPFRNAWFGVSTQAVMTVSLTGTFTPTSWRIDGGTVAFSDPAFQCAFGDFTGFLCAPRSLGGGFQGNGSHLGWGMSQGSGPGTSITTIDVRNTTATVFFERLSGVLADVTIGPDGNITTQQGEWRNAAGATTGLGDCSTHIRYDGNAIVCGRLQAGTLAITGRVAMVPLPPALWLFGAGLAGLAVVRRRLPA